MSEVWIVLGDRKDRIVSPCLLDLTHHNGLHSTRVSSSAGYTEETCYDVASVIAMVSVGWEDCLGFLQCVLMAQMLTQIRENLLLD